MNSLRNRKIKIFLIVTILTVLLLTAILLAFLHWSQENNKEEILTKYEVEGLAESLALEEIHNQFYENSYILLAYFVVMLLLMVICFLAVLNNNEKEIRKVRNYLQEMANSNYQLDIENMSESEMSNLKNEIYKIVLELKERTENLAKDRETLSNYLADISHQIRTPLMAITAMVDAMIEKEDTLEENNRKFVYEISRQLNQMNWLVDNLLKMAQLDTKTIEFHKEDTNIKQLVEKVEKNMSLFLELKNQQLSIEMAENISAKLDEKWMIEAIENILKNSIEHSNENTEIKIKAEQTPLYVQLTIKDHGSGISKKDLPRIFDKFYKGEKANKNSFGIGLSLAKSIIESHNGEITVESEKGKGTTFFIKLYQ